MLEAITVHGRFQPPLHINHWNYISTAFDIAQKVIILITNPYLNEQAVGNATHRNSGENNPFTYEERIAIFTSFFKNKNISSDRYEFKPFDITHDDAWVNVLDKNIPNLVNTYSPWSEEKLMKFQKNGFLVIHTNKPKIIPISGTGVRNILWSNQTQEKKYTQLLQEGYMPEAINGLFDVLKNGSKNK